jgi:hypothetical protein
MWLMIQLLCRAAKLLRLLLLLRTQCNIPAGIDSRVAVDASAAAGGIWLVRC